MRRRRPGLPTSRARAAAPLRPPSVIAIGYRPCAQRGLWLPRSPGPAELGTPGGGGTKGGGVETAKWDDSWDHPGSPAGLGRQQSAGAAAGSPCPPPARTPPGPRRDTRSRRCISARPANSFPAASFAGWDLPPQTNHKTYANKGRARRGGPSWCPGPGIAGSTLCPAFLPRLLFTSIWNYVVCLLSVLLAVLGGRVCLMSTVVLTCGERANPLIKF